MPRKPGRKPVRRPAARGEGRRAAPKPSYIVRPDTAVLIRGFDPALSVGSARPAVFRSSTYVFRTPESAERAFAVALGKVRPAEGEDVDLIYSRLSHPNAEILEDQLLPLEPQAAGAAVFNAGLAAIATMFLTLLRPGDSLVFTEPLYGGTHHLVQELLVPLGVHAVPVRAGDGKAMAAAVAAARSLRLVLVESPANPTLVMSDIAAAAAAARARAERPVVAVDNTFMGPVFQHPLVLGADLSVYSATKYLAGHSDMLAGAILGRDRELVQRLRGMRAILGTILQPDECWLLDGRIATVALRMNRQSKNAERIVAGLQGHRRIQRLHYPSLFEDREQRRIYRAQCAFPGAIFSMEIRGGKPAAFDFIRRLGIVKDAVSLGGVESLCCHPASTTHSEMPAEDLRTSGISPSLVRISVGVEDWRDLLADIRRALDGIGKG